MMVITVFPFTLCYFFYVKIFHQDFFKEPRTDKDEDNCKRINELLNNPSSAVQSSNNPDQDLQSLLNNMSQSQLMQLFGGGVGQIGGLSSLLGTLRLVNFRLLFFFCENKAATIYKTRNIKRN